MKFLTNFPVVIGLLWALQETSITAAPPSPGKTQCPTDCRPEDKLRRRAWHTFSPSEKQSYLDAELCLMWQKPARTDHPTVVSLFDDLQATHSRQVWRVHGSGWFLPFHRYLMWAHEKLLRDECGYKGAQPYWDEPGEAGKFISSHNFDTKLGFGGNGNGADFTVSLDESMFPFNFTATAKCITDGPFANYTLRVGPTDVRNEPHCLSRDINDEVSLGSAQAEVDACMNKPTFAEAWPCFELNPHRGGHGGVGGEMRNPISSPGDPLFYLHHTWLDKIWWDWQMKDPVNRSKDISGYTGIRPIELAPDGTEGTGGGWGFVNATLKDVLHLHGILPNITVGHSLDVLSGLMGCIEYVPPDHPPQQKPRM